MQEASNPKGSSPLLRVIAWPLRMLSRQISRQVFQLKRQLRKIGFNWKTVEEKFQVYLKGSENGVTATKRSPQLVVSLTSYPPRIPRIQYTIYSLLKQTMKPDEIVLWLAEEQFPNREADLPAALLQLVDHGLSIKYCKDIKSYKKLIPALKEYPEDIIVTVDDDAYYMPTMLASLFSSYEKNKNAVHGHSGHIIKLLKNDMPANYLNWNSGVSFRETMPSFRNFVVGVGGVLYPPNVLHQDILREDLFMQIAPTSDDVWFWGMTVLNGMEICIVENNLGNPITNFSADDTCGKSRHHGLMKVNWDEGGNDRYVRQILEHYPVILERIKMK